MNLSTAYDLKELSSMNTSVNQHKPVRLGLARWWSLARAPLRTLSAGVFSGCFSLKGAALGSARVRNLTCVVVQPRAHVVRRTAPRGLRVTVRAYLNLPGHPQSSGTHMYNTCNKTCIHTHRQKLRNKSISHAIGIDLILPGVIILAVDRKQLSWSPR